MAIAEAIKKKITENSSLIFTATGKDYMVIGGTVSNLLPTDVFLTLKPFLINARISPWEPFQLQTKLLLTQGEIITAWVSNAPININWLSGDSEDWNVEDINDWNSAQTGSVSIFLNLIVAGL